MKLWKKILEFLSFEESEDFSMELSDQLFGMFQ